MADQHATTEMAAIETVAGAEEPKEGQPTGERHALSPDEAKARRGRNIAIAIGVVGFVAMIYLTTILRLVQNIEAGR